MAKARTFSQPTLAPGDWLRGRGLEIIATKLANLGVSTEEASFFGIAPRPIPDQMMLLKVDILMKNPDMFRRFKERALESRHLNEYCVKEVLMEFLANEVKIPEMQEDIKAANEKDSQRRVVLDFSKQEALKSPEEPVEGRKDNSRDLQDTESDTTGDDLSAVSI